MSRRLTALSLFAVGVSALGAVAQQPPPAEKKTETKSVFGSPKMTGWTGTKTAIAADAAIEAALANDPDVRMARAKIQLAEAELAKARQLVTQKVLTLRSAIAEQKKAVATAEESFALVTQANGRNMVSRAELLVAREKLEATSAALARSETELKLITGDDGKLAGTNRTVVDTVVLGDAQARRDYAAALAAAHEAWGKAATGPIPERIRAALDKPIKLGEKNEKVTFDKALEAFKKVGLDVPVRNSFTVNPVSSLGVELPVGAWFQMFADETPELLFLVREYGLFITVKNPNTAPADALSVFELWKQKSAAEPKK